MIFSEYKNYLERNNINLFDCYYRLSYYGLIELSNKFTVQTGGGYNNNFLQPFIALKKLDKIKMLRLIESILSNNFKTAKYICDTC